MNDFLTQLRKTRQQGVTRQRGASTDFFFRLATDDRGCYVQTVDKQGKPVCPDCRAYSGDRAQALRTMDRLREEGLLELNWEGTDATSSTWPTLPTGWASWYAAPIW